MKRLLVIAVAAFAVAVPASASASMTTLTVINHAGLSKTALAHAEAAIQYQVNHALNSAWHNKLIRFGPGGEPITFKPLKQLGNCGCLGYHDEKNGHGQPFALVGVGGGYSWTDTFSHEVMEMTVDPHPYSNPRLIYSYNQYYGDYTYWLVEVGDPVEDWAYFGKYGVLISDFATPHWYTLNTTAPWDKLHGLSGAQTFSPGSGFAYYYVNGSWYPAPSHTHRHTTRRTNGSLCLTCIPTR